MVYLTGASGFLGKRLVDKFSKSNIKTLCLSRYKKHSYDNNIKWQQADLTSLPLENDLLKGCSVIVHVAGALKGSAAYLNDFNCRATEKLLTIAKRYKIKKFVFISSIDAVLLNTAYARSKKNAEEKVENSGLNWLIIRPSVIFGENDTKNFTVLNNLIKKSPLIPLPHKGLFRWEPVFVDDLAQYITRCAVDDNISNKVINVVGPERLTFYDIVKQLEKHNNVRKIKLPISSQTMSFLKKVFSAVLGTRKAEEIFSSFTDKIVSEGPDEKIKLSIKFNQIYP